MKKKEETKHYVAMVKSTQPIHANTHYLFNLEAKTYDEAVKEGKMCYGWRFLGVKEGRI